MRDVYGNSIASEINSKNYAKVFGEKVYCIGADNVRQVAKIRGSEIAYAAVDEATDINKEVFEMLKSRLSLPWSCCDITTNPASPNHWFKQFLDSEKQGVDIYCQNYTLYDNPFLPEEYVHALETEYAGGVWFDRYILGKWTLAEGLIFANYTKALVDEWEIPTTESEYALSIDYGTSNPFAVLLWKRCGNVWYAIKELYYSGRDTGVQKTDDEYLCMLEDLIEPIKPLLLEKGYNAFDGHYERINPISVIIDPSAASFIALLRQSDWFRVREADNSVIDGIRNTSTTIERGLIKVSKTCKHWQDEAQSYVWDEKAVDDRPVKENDHLMDSMRYFVQTMRLVRPYDNYSSPFERR
jgi:PBSX family phage terminase large subunit